MSSVFEFITIVIAIASLIISLIALSISKREYEGKIQAENNERLKKYFLFIMKRFPNLTMGQIADELLVSRELTYDLFLEMQIIDRTIDTKDYPITNDSKWHILAKIIEK